ncbi:MAG: hypothetical protein ACMXYG_06595 [Candidatus Woesearchaeota archaeon]
MVTNAVDKVVTFLRSDSSFIGKLNSTLEAIVWDYDAVTGNLDNPHTVTLSIPNFVPTRLTKNPHFPSIKAGVENYKNKIKEMYQEIFNDLNSKLKSKKTGTKIFRDLQKKHQEVKKFLENIDQNIRLEQGVRAGSYATYVLRVPPLDKKYQKLFLPGIFNTGRYSSHERHVRYEINFPFSIVQEKDGVYIPTGRRPKLEHLVNATDMAIDFETQDWKKVRVKQELSNKDLPDLQQRLDNLIDAFKVDFDKRKYQWMRKRHYLTAIEDILDKNKNERITAASLITLKEHNYVITTLDCGHDEMEVQIPGTDEYCKVKIIKVKDQHELIEQVNHYAVDVINPFFVHGHNHLKFDFGKAEELTGNLRIGVERRPALHVAQTPEGFIVQRVSQGRVDIDASVYSQNYMKNRNNRLDVVFQNATGIKVKKSIETHDELAVKTALAEQGDKDAAYETIYYAAQDSMKSVISGRKILPENLLLAIAGNSLPARIDTTAKKTIGEDIWVKKYWEKKKSYPDDIQNLVDSETQKTFNDFSHTSYFHSLLQRHGLDIKSTKGIFEGIVVELFPFANIYKEILCSDCDLEQLYDYVQSTDDPKVRSRLLRGLESFAEYPLFRTIDDKMFDKKFSAEFELGFDKDYLEYYRSKIDNVISNLVKQFQSSGIINIHDGTFILPVDTSDDVLKYIEDNQLGVVLGKGKFLSGSTRQIAGLIDDELIMLGIADYQSNKGMRCQFEKDFYNNFIHLVLESGLESGLEYLIEQCNDLALGNIPESDLIYTWEARRDHNEYSAKYKSKKKEIMQELKTKKGDKVEKKLTLEELQLKLFGFTPDYTSRLSSYNEYKAQMRQYKIQLSQYNNREDDMPLFSDQIQQPIAPVEVLKPDLIEGSISKLVNWALGLSKEQGFGKLNDVYLGRIPRDQVKQTITMLIN